MGGGEAVTERDWKYLMIGFVIGFIFGVVCIVVPS
jgi:uncharacterized membrane-anchored protein YhcB (DUF1043 family)